MARAEAPAQRYHVVTYVRNARDGVEDVLAEGTVAVPAAKGVDGDLVEGVLSKVDQYQCDGHGHGTDGCKENHPHAVERIRVRLAKADGTVNVVYRKYHPLLGQGAAQPGKPYEADCDGVHVRVEVRRILEENKEELTQEAVSQLSLRRMQQELAPRVQLAASRMQVRSAFAKMVDLHLEAAQEQIAAGKKRFAELPNQEEVEAATRAVEAAAQAIVDEAGAKLKEALEDKALNAQSAKRFEAALAQLEKRFAGIFAPFQKIEQQAARLLAVQQAVRAQLEAADAQLERLAGAKDQHRTLRFDKKPLTELKAELRALLEGTKQQAGAQALGAIEKQAAALAAPIQAQARLLDGEIGGAEADARAFALRVAAHQRWRNEPALALTDLKDTITSAGAFAAVPLAYWLGRADGLQPALGRLSDLAGLRYDDADADKRLAAAEKELKPVRELLAALGKDLRALVEGAYAPLALAGAAVVAPTAWVKVQHKRKDKSFDLELHLINNDARAMQLQILAGPEKRALQEVVLAERGQRLSFALEKIAPPIAFRLTAVVPDGGAPPIAGAAQMRRVDVPSAELGFENEGATHFNLPCNWTPAALQLGEALQVAVAPPQGARASAQPILGKE